MMIGELRTFTCIKSRTFRHFIQRIFRDKDKNYNRQYFLFYGFHSDIFCSIDLLFLWQG